MTAVDMWNDSETAERFLGHYETLRGQVRAEVSFRHLCEAVPEIAHGSLHVLDIGAGDGRDGLRLASLGHDVVALDPAEEMVTQARRRAETEDVKGRFQVELGDAHWALDKYGPESFDLVLSHGVLMYQAETSAFLGAHIDLLRPLGVLSVITKNADGMSFRAATEGRFDEALRLLDSSDAVGNLGLHTRAHTVQEISDAVLPHGGTVFSWAGLRIFTDGPLAEEPVDPDKVIELEWQTSRRDPQRQVAALVHVLVQRGVDLQFLDDNS